MKAGILLPRSTIYPLIGVDFADGCKTYLQYREIATSFELLTDNIGFGLDEAEVYSRNEEMLLKHNADVVVAFLDGRSAEMLQPLFTATNKILLLVNMGAHYFYDALSSPTTLYHTFDTAFNSRLTGKLAADENHLKGIMATSYYDGGYLQCYAMLSRYQQAGGNIGHNFISHFKPAEFSMKPLEDFMNTNPDYDTLFCLYSGDVSPKVFKELSVWQQTKNLHLYLSPMMLDEALKETPGLSINMKQAKGYTAWNSALENGDNISFKKTFQETTGRKAGIFGLLGWETGILLEEIQKMMKEGNKGREVVKALQQKTFSSPRGWMKIDPQTNQTYSPSYLVSCNGNFDFAIGQIIEDAEEERKNFFTEIPEGAASGWRNSYLCS